MDNSRRQTGLTRLGMAPAPHPPRNAEAVPKQTPFTEHLLIGGLFQESGDHPVFLTRMDVHSALVNSAAMRAAGITADTPDPVGGSIERDAHGNPTGILRFNTFPPSPSPPPAVAYLTLRFLPHFRCYSFGRATLLIADAFSADGTPEVTVHLPRETQGCCNNAHQVCDAPANSGGQGCSSAGCDRLPPGAHPTCPCPHSRPWLREAREGDVCGQSLNPILRSAGAAAREVDAALDLHSV